MTFPKTLRGSNKRLLETTRRLGDERLLRKKVVAALNTAHSEHKALQDDSRLMQAQLRNLTRQLLSAQEEERKKISRELHDSIAQILAGINVHLLTLNREASLSNSGIKKRIASTQRLVQQSLDALVVTDTELRVRLWNPAAERLYGIPASLAIGQMFTAVIATLDLDGTPVDDGVSRTELDTTGVWRQRVIHRPVIGPMAGQEVELSLSTRESPHFRNHAFKLGFTSMSAGSKTNPGGYANVEESLEQFVISDERTPAEVSAFLKSAGYEAVWKDWDATYDGQSNLNREEREGREAISGVVSSS